MSEFNCFDYSVQEVLGRLGTKIELRHFAPCGDGHYGQVAALNEFLDQYGVATVEVKWDHDKTEQFVASAGVPYLLRCELMSGEMHVMACVGNRVVLDTSEGVVYNPHSMLFFVVKEVSDEGQA